MNDSYLTCIVSVMIVSIIYSLVITIKDFKSQKQIKALKAGIVLYEAMLNMYHTTLKNLTKNIEKEKKEND